MATFTAGTLGIDFDILDLGPLASGLTTSMTETSQEIRSNGVITQFFGTGFQYAGSGPPVSGTINRIVVASVEEVTTWLRLSRRVPPRERFSPEEWTETTKRLLV